MTACGRRAVLRGVAATSVAALASCRSVGSSGQPEPAGSREGAGSLDGGVPPGRLTFRPRRYGRRPRQGQGTPRLLRVRGARGTPPALLYVPATEGGAAAKARPLRMVVMLHGAGSGPRRGIELMRAQADRVGLLVLAPKSVGPTWDAVGGAYGPDVQNIDALLDQVSADHGVSRYCVGGFSDGASYALSLGLGNGDLFGDVVAFSPGFVAAHERHGSPRFFVSHGTEDRILPIDRCSRRIVPALEEAGHPVTYQEFTGGHAVPPPIRQQAADWLLRG